MKPFPLGRRLLLWVGIALAWPGVAPRALGQDADPAATEQPDDDLSKAMPDSRFKILSDPEGMKKAAKEKQRPPLEFFRTQVAPFDILPFVKANHWATVGLELRANYADYEGRLQTAPVRLGPKQVVAYRREARLLKGQHSRISLQAMLPAIPRELALELARPDSIRADELMTAPLRPLPPHQMLIMVLARNPNDYGGPLWARSHALLPTSGDRDPLAMDQQRYYRLVLPQEPEKPLLSPHPLTWTTISHVIWDGLAPEALTVGQQQAMLDWLHWGGQLILVGGAGATFAQWKDSALGPLLPADPAGENVLLGQADLEPLAQAYRPPAAAPDPDEPMAYAERDPSRPIDRYQPAESIRPAPKRPVYFAGLRPRQGVGIPLKVEGSDRLLGVERRVGRGRITMLAFSPNDPALAAWPGFDTLLRRLLLRRPEESPIDPAASSNDANGSPPPSPSGAYRSMMSRHYPFLGGPDLSWVRYLARDLGADPATLTRFVPGERELSRQPVAEWTDDAALPGMCRSALKEASGITVPGRGFILKVIVAYIVALVPLNWLFCRFVLRRREWSWALVPVLALGFAIGVERAAAYDLGFDSGCDEIDLMELYAGYPRAHLSRFGALFSTGRVRYAIAYPDDPTALALPMSTGDELRGEEATQSAWQSLPVPALVDFQVQPRSLALFRAEQMVSLPGTIELRTDARPYRVVNGTDLELRDAAYIDVDGVRRVPLGTIGPGATVVVPEEGRGSRPGSEPRAAIWTNPEPLLDPLREFRGGRPEDRGEIRLVAWAEKALPGQTVQPTVDRHRALTLVVAHLRIGHPPSPDLPEYDALAKRPEADRLRPDPVSADVRPRPRRSARPRAPTGFGPARR